MRADGTGAHTAPRHAPLPHHPHRTHAPYPHLPLPLHTPPHTHTRSSYSSDNIPHSLEWRRGPPRSTRPHARRSRPVEHSRALHCSIVPTTVLHARTAALMPWLYGDLPGAGATRDSGGAFACSYLWVLSNAIWVAGLVACAA